MSSAAAADTNPTAPRPAPARRSWSLAARLTAWYAGSSFLLIAGSTIFLYWVLLTNLDREDNQFLSDKVHVLRALLRDHPDDLKGIKREVEEEWTARQYAQVFVRIMDADQHVVLETPGMAPDLAAGVFPEPSEVDAEPGGAREIESKDGKTYLILAVRAAAGRSGRETRVVQIAFDRTYEEELLAGYRRNLWIVLGVALVVCTFAGYRIARRGLRPVAEITEAARRIRAATLSERINAADFPAELSTLGATFNEMLDRLEESFGRLSRFSADIAHELRTPVNNLRGEAEVALGQPRAPEEYREVLGSCLEECGRLARLIDSLLFLARAENPRTQIERQTIDIGRELHAVRDFYEPAATDAGISLVVDSANGILAPLDRTLFQRALGNLVANAVAHTPAGGVITLAAASDRDCVVVEIADTGSGIGPEHLPHVFDRFYRADQARSSASGRVGLGLAIVKSIASLHGGSVTIASEAKKGTRVQLTFPVKPAPSPFIDSTK